MNNRFERYRNRVVANLRKWITLGIVSSFLFSQAPVVHANCYDDYVPYDMHCGGTAYCESAWASLWCYGGYVLLFAGIAAIVYITFAPTHSNSNSH